MEEQYKKFETMMKEVDQTPISEFNLIVFAMKYAAIFVKFGVREPLMKMAELCRRYNMPNQAMAYAAAASQIKPDPEWPIDEKYESYYQEKPHEILYWAYRELGDIKAAEVHFFACIGYKPLDPMYLYDLQFFIDMPSVTVFTEDAGPAANFTHESIKNLNYPPSKIKTVVLKNIHEINEYSRKIDTDFILYVSEGHKLDRNALVFAYKVASDNGKKFLTLNNVDFENKFSGIAFLMHTSIIKKLENVIFDEDLRERGAIQLLREKMVILLQHMICSQAIVYGDFHDVQISEAEQILIDNKIVEFTEKTYGLHTT